MIAPLSSCHVLPLLLVLVLAAFVADCMQPSDFPLEAPQHIIMPWLCLQRCGFNVSQIEEQINNIKHHNDAFRQNATKGEPLINAVSFEMYNLGSSANVVNNGFFDANRRLMETLPDVLRAPMVTSASLSDMRTLFGNETAFIAKLVDEVVQRDMHGINVDFEPTEPTTDADGVAYAAFAKRLRQAMSIAGKFASFDIAVWSKIWNYTAIAEAITGPSTPLNSTAPVWTQTGYAGTMNTYTFYDSVFPKELNISLSAFAPPGASASEKRRLLVGLDTWPNNMTEARLDFHFHLLATNDVCQIALWDTPIPDRWWPKLEELTRRCVH